MRYWQGGEGLAGLFTDTSKVVNMATIFTVQERGRGRGERGGK